MCRLGDRRRLGRIAACFLVFLSAAACSGSPPQAVLTGNLPLDLGEHLDVATIIGSGVSADVRQPVEWRFDEPQPGWQVTAPQPSPAGLSPALVSQTADALRITLQPLPASLSGRWLGVGSVHVDVPEWDHQDWAHVVIQARSSGPGNIGLGFNVWDPDGDYDAASTSPFQMAGAQNTGLVGDNTVQTYQLQLEPGRPWEGPIEQFCVEIWSRAPLTVEILSITVVPVDTLYAESAGVSPWSGDWFGEAPVVYIRAPGRIDFPVEVPATGRLRLALGVLRDDAPVTFSVSVRSGDGRTDRLLDQVWADRTEWAPRSIDLAPFAGEPVTLTLEAASDRQGTVALWMSPVLYEAKLSPRAVVNVAHRGGIVPGYPENTLAAFRRAIAIGVDAIEIDLRGTKDSEIVIIHGGLAATTNGQGGTRNHTLAELLRLDAGGGERIPTYEAVLELVAGTGVTLLLDVNAGPELDRRKVVRQTERYDAVADVIAGVRTLDDLRLFQQLNPDIRTLGFIGDLDELDDFVAAGVDIIRLWPPWIWADPATVTRLQGMGIPVWTTAGQASREELESLISLGIDGILTDFPGVMAELVTSREAASGGR